MIKVMALLVIFSNAGTINGNDVPTIVPFDSMDSCMNAKTTLLMKYDESKKSFWGGGPRWTLTDERVDCVSVAPQ
jgi:hypothetical protein